MSFLPKHEQHRLSQYAFRDDAVRSLVGQLLIRYGVSRIANIKLQDVNILRKNSKPYLNIGDLEDGVHTTDFPLEQLQFSVSHQGDFVVFASEVGAAIDVDMISWRYPLHKDISQYLNVTKIHACDNEWDTLLAQQTIEEKVATVYRFWAAKEAGFKTGFFKIRACYSLDCTSRVSETCKALYHEQDENWWISEHYLDEHHAATVLTSGQNDQNLKFEEVEIDEILDLYEGDVLQSPINSAADADAPIRLSDVLSKPRSMLWN